MGRFEGESCAFYLLYIVEYLHRILFIGFSSSDNAEKRILTMDKISVA